MNKYRFRSVLNFTFELCGFCIQVYFFLLLLLFSAFFSVNKSECTAHFCCYLGFLFDFYTLFHFLWEQLMFVWIFRIFTVHERIFEYVCLLVVVYGFCWSHFKMILWNVDTICFLFVCKICSCSFKIYMDCWDGCHISNLSRKSGGKKTVNIFRCMENFQKKIPNSVHGSSFFS